MPSVLPDLGSCCGSGDRWYQPRDGTSETPASYSSCGPLVRWQSTRFLRMFPQQGADATVRVLGCGLPLQIGVAENVTQPPVWARYMIKAFESVPSNCDAKFVEVSLQFRHSSCIQLRANPAASCEAVRRVLAEVYCVHLGPLPQWPVHVIAAQRLRRAKMFFAFLKCVSSCHGPRARDANAVDHSCCIATSSSSCGAQRSQLGIVPPPIQVSAVSHVDTFVFVEVATLPSVEILCLEVLPVLSQG